MYDKLNKMKYTPLPLYYIILYIPVPNPKYYLQIDVII